MKASDQGKSFDPTVARPFWQSCRISRNSERLEPMPDRFLMFVATAAVLTARKRQSDGIGW